MNVCCKGKYYWSEENTWRKHTSDIQWNWGSLGLNALAIFECEKTFLFLHANYPDYRPGDSTCEMVQGDAKNIL